jgi:hypothetical protein
MSDLAEHAAADEPAAPGSTDTFVAEASAALEEVALEQGADAALQVAREMAAVAFVFELQTSVVAQGPRSISGPQRCDERPRIGDGRIIYWWRASWSRSGFF